MKNWYIKSLLSQCNLISQAVGSDGAEHGPGQPHGHHESHTDAQQEGLLAMEDGPAARERRNHAQNQHHEHHVDKGECYLSQWTGAE